MAELSLHTLAGCSLAIGGYPRFDYDASGGRGVATLAETDASRAQMLRFDSTGLSIPPLHWRTTRFLGLPLPPGLAITIHPERLDGSLDPPRGAMELQFRARFRFAIAGLYRAPDLIVETTLGTGAAQGRRHHGRGQPLDGDGRAVLVGVATIAPSGDRWLDRFLGLPDEALAQLHCRFVAQEGSDLP
jgi:hypothetical protein